MENNIKYKNKRVYKIFTMPSDLVKKRIFRMFNQKRATDYYFSSYDWLYWYLWFDYKTGMSFLSSELKSSEEDATLVFEELMKNLFIDMTKDEIKKCYFGIVMGDLEKWVPVEKKMNVKDFIKVKKSLEILDKMYGSAIVKDKHIALMIKERMSDILEKNKSKELKEQEKLFDYVKWENPETINIKLVTESQDFAVIDEYKMPEEEWDFIFCRWIASAYSIDTIMKNIASNKEWHLNVERFKKFSHYYKMYLNKIISEYDNPFAYGTSGIIGNLYFLRKIPFSFELYNLFRKLTLSHPDKKDEDNFKSDIKITVKKELENLKEVDSRLKRDVLN